MNEKITAAAKAQLDTSMQLVNFMYQNPEIGNEEFKAMDVLCKELTAKGFEVTEGFVVPTGFIGKYDSGKTGPTIAFLCEYDALPGIGHGCGHNLIAGIGLTAGVALKSVIDELGGQVWVVGTPAEENFGGKISMAEAGVFDQVDAAMMIHPNTETGLGGRTNALMPLKFEFFGQTAHGCHPQEGISALDAAILSFVNINMIRQFVEPDTYIHGIIRDGGKAANIIPDYASLEYYFRGSSMAYVNELCAKAKNAVDAACLTTGCTSKTTVYECPYEDFVINYTLCDMLGEKLSALGVDDIKPVNEKPQGSSDIGAVSYRCPALHGYIKIAPECVNAHSVELAAATISPEGKDGLLKSAIALAQIGADLIADPQKLQLVKEEFANTNK